MYLEVEYLVHDEGVGEEAGEDEEGGGGPHPLPVPLRDPPVPLRALPAPVPGQVDSVFTK